MKKMYLKRALSLTLALLMVLALVACGGDKPSSTSSSPSNSSTSSAPSASSTSTPTDVKYKERIVIVNSMVMTEEDPPKTNTAMNSHIYYMRHNTLIGRNKVTSEFYPELAYEWNISDDGLVYTFKLRNDVKFHNGADFTAEDVIYSLEHAAQSSYQAAKLADIEKVDAVDEYTLKITLSAINSEFLSHLAAGYLSIICKEAVDADPDHGYKIGTGPYIQTEWVPDDHVTLTRNENYWGEMPKTKVIEYRKVSEAAARVIGLQTGEYDICLAVSASDVPHVEADEDCTMVTLPGINLHYLGINTISETNPALQDVRVRQALNYATNHEDLVIAMTEGYGDVPHGVIPQGAYGYSDKVNAPTYDIEKAKALLAEAGYPNGITLSLTTNAANWPGVFELLQAMWAPAGINLTLDTDDATIRLEHLRAKTYDLLSTNMTFTETNTVLYNIWGSTSGSNRSLIKDPYIDDMLTKALRQTDEAKVLEIYAELSQYLVNTNGIIPLYIAPVLYGVNKNLEGGELGYAASVDLSYAYVVEK